MFKKFKAIKYFQINIFNRSNRDFVFSKRFLSLSFLYPITQIKIFFCVAIRQ